MATGSKQDFVCPECERIVVPAGERRWLARCEAGHRLRVLHSRPLWLTGVLGFVAGYFVLHTAMHGINLFLRDTNAEWVKAVVLAAAGVSGVYLVVVGRDYAGRPEPMRPLGRHDIAEGIGRMAATLLVSAVAWMGLST